MMNPRYPNLELIDYKAKELFFRDEELKNKFMELKSKRKYTYIDMEAIVFPQVWGSTCTGFDVMPDGSAAIGGCAMTKEYTTVIHENTTDVYFVFFGDKPCYMVSNANEKFYENLNNRQMASLSESKKLY